MNWKNPKNELPTNGSIVCVLYQHWKKHKYKSSQILFGETEYSYDGEDCRVDTRDFTGQGSFCINLKDNETVAWCYANEFNLPEWIEHDEHWGDA